MGEGGVRVFAVVLALTPAHTDLPSPRASPPGLTGDRSDPCVEFVEDEDVIAVVNPAR